MRASDYQSKTAQTAIYPGAGEIGGLVYTVLGLAGEAGEIANKTKKVLRDSDGVLEAGKREALVGELGDVAWYLAQTATELGVNLDDVFKDNLDKLKKRKEKGTLKGDGDNR